MNRVVFAAFFALSLTCCQSKNEKKPKVPAANFFPVPAYIRGELARLDTSLASFYKIETANGRSDTTAIRNTEARNYAQDFLALPDLSAPELKDDYELTQLYDDLQGVFVFNFTTQADHPVKQEDVTVDPQPNAAGKNDIKSIYANVEQTTGTTTVLKRLLWEAGKGFTTTTITRIGTGGEEVRKVQVIWNGFDSDKRRSDSL